MVESKPQEPRASTADGPAWLAATLEEIGKVFIGPPELVEVLLVALLAPGHVLLEGVPGVAKTTLVKAFAQLLGCEFRRIQFTPDLLPADITGTYILDMGTNRFVLRKGPIFAQIILGDEINRAPAKTQSALLEAMQEHQVTVEGVTQQLVEPFMVLATQNPIEQEGVYLLPEAQLDRFLVKVQIGYPDVLQERAILQTYHRAVPQVRPCFTPQEVLGLRSRVEQVHVEDELMEYIVRLVRYTREHEQVALGASPRAALALMRAAKARALLHGRSFVLPDDVRVLLPPVLRHRILLTPEAELEGFGVATLLAEAQAEVAYAR
ncbi:MAG: AAA family ATPase [Deltaproteobacteria bacterium]|nr:AAA family ATPase [Deltaproteobacteria bacterium]